MSVPEYRVAVVVQELDADTDEWRSVGKAVEYPWKGGRKLIHGLTEADRIATVLSVAQVPGA